MYHDFFLKCVCKTCLTRAKFMYRYSERIFYSILSFGKASIFFTSILTADAEALSLKGFSLTFKLNFRYESTISIELFKLLAQGIAFAT